MQDSKIACLCQSVEINNKNMYIARTRCESQLAMKSSGLKWMLAHHRDGLLSSSFLAWSSIAQLICERAFSMLAIKCLRHPSFESCIQQRKTTCLLSIRKSLACARASKLTTNIYIATARCKSQSAVKSSGLNARSPLGQAVEFKFFSLILDSSVGLWVGIQSAGD